MSTGLNCQVVRIETGEWFYILEDSNAPKAAWDWREYATAYGPFPSEDAALADLRRNHANPGGWWTGIVSTEEPIIARLVTEARERKKRRP